MRDRRLHELVCAQLCILCDVHANTYCEIVWDANLKKLACSKSLKVLRHLCI